jgi:hypothetical protein
MQLQIPTADTYRACSYRCSGMLTHERLGAVKIAFNFCRVDVMLQVGSPPAAEGRSSPLPRSSDTKKAVYRRSPAVECWNLQIQIVPWS